MSPTRRFASRARFLLDSVANIDAQVICTGNACTAEQSVLARFVEVTVTPTTIPTILPASFVAVGRLNTVTAGARATAGMDQVVCDFTPMFICNPYSTPGMTYDQATAALQAAVANPVMRRRLIEMRRAAGVMDNTAREITASWTIPRLAMEPMPFATRSRWSRRPLASGKTAWTHSPALSRR